MSPSLLAAGRRLFTVPELALVAVTMVWGGTFLTVQHGVAVSGPLFFVGARFGLAALLTMALLFRVLSGMTLRELGAGATTAPLFTLPTHFRHSGCRRSPAASQHSSPHFTSQWCRCCTGCCCGAGLT